MTENTHRRGVIETRDAVFRCKRGARTRGAKETQRESKTTEEEEKREIIIYDSVVEMRKSVDEAWSVYCP